MWVNLEKKIVLEFPVVGGVCECRRAGSGISRRIVAALLPEPDVVYLDLAGGQKIWFASPTFPTAGEQCEFPGGGIFLL